MTLHGETIGVIVYGYGPLALKARNIATNNIYVRNGKQMNRELRTISRVVILPKYRGIGLSVKIIKDTKHLVGVRFIEILSVMGVNNPFAIKAGLTDIPYSRDVKGVEKKSNQLLEDLGFDHTLMNSEKYNLEKLQEIAYETKEDLFNMLCKVHNMGKGNAGKRYSDHGDTYLAWLIKRTRISHKAYAIWENPDWVDTYVPPVEEEIVEQTPQIETPEERIVEEEVINPETYSQETLKKFYEEKMIIDVERNRSILEKIKEIYMIVNESKRQRVLALLEDYKISKMTETETPTDILEEVYKILSA